MEVRDVMSPRPVTIEPDESAALAARLLARHDVGFLPVCDGGARLLGVVTDRDIVLRCVAAGEDPSALPAKRVMSRRTETAAPGDDLRAAAETMARAQVRRLPVVEDGRLVGTVSLGDLAKSGACEMEVSRALTAVSDPVRRAL